MESKVEKISAEIKKEPYVAVPIKPLRVGIICSETNREDLLYYKEELIAVNKKLEGNVRLVIFGYDGIDEDDDWLNGVDFEFVKPVSIIHYFKQLSALNLDVLFIPLIRSIFNATSENYNKYLEAALFNIPIVTVNIYPYNTLIIDKRNGFIFKEKYEIVPLFEHLYIQRDLVKAVGKLANEIVTTEFNYSKENSKFLMDIFD